MFKSVTPKVDFPKLEGEISDYWKKNNIIRDNKVLEAFTKVKREDFVLQEYKDNAYDDIALPSKANQTISQPTTVLIMTQALEVKPGQKILEVGAGSGYQAAILSVIVGKKGRIYTTEILKEPYDFAKQNLKNYKNVKVFHTDGSKGLKDFAPYDRVIVTAAAKNIPQALLEQLKTGGIMVIPVGESRYVQQMLKIKKTKEKNIIENLGDFVFVPLRET